MSQCYVIKQMVNTTGCTIELWMHLGGLLRTQEAKVALGYRLNKLFISIQNLKQLSQPQAIVSRNICF